MEKLSCDRLSLRDHAFKNSLSLNLIGIGGKKMLMDACRWKAYTFAIWRANQTLFQGENVLFIFFGD